MKRTVRGLTHEAKTRLEVVKDFETGKYSKVELAKKYKLHRDTIHDWLTIYNEEGIAGLEKPLRPILRTQLDAAAIAAAMEAETAPAKLARLARLARLAAGEKLYMIAREECVSAQIIMRDRAKFAANGKL